MWIFPSGLTVNALSGCSSRISNNNMWRPEDALTDQQSVEIFYIVCVLGVSISDKKECVLSGLLPGLRTLDNCHLAAVVTSD